MHIHIKTSNLHKIPCFLQNFNPCFLANCVTRKNFRIFSSHAYQNDKISSNQSTNSLKSKFQMYKDNFLKTVDPYGDFKCPPDEASFAHHDHKPYDPSTHPMVPPYPNPRMFRTWPPENDFRRWHPMGNPMHTPRGYYEDLFYRIIYYIFVKRTSTAILSVLLLAFIGEYSFHFLTDLTWKYLNKGYNFSEIHPLFINPISDELTKANIILKTQHPLSDLTSDVIV